MKRYLLTIFISVLIFGSANSTIHTVPGNFATIQDALNACAAMDTIVVQPGTYLENLTWPTSVNGIKLLGSSSANTIVNGGGSNRCLHEDPE